MRYTNSEKVPWSYLVKEKEKIRKLLDENDFPFMEEYRQRFEGISDLEERYEQLKEYTHLSDEISDWIKSEEFKKKVARYYIESDTLFDSGFFESILHENPVAEIGCLTEWQDFVRQYCQKSGVSWKEHFISRYWGWEGCLERRNFSPIEHRPMDNEVIFFLTKVMQIPDEQLLNDVFDFLSIEEPRFYDVSDIPSDVMRVKGDFCRITLWKNYEEEFRASALSRKYKNWLVGFDFSGQDLSTAEGFHFRKCNLKDTNAVIDLGYRPDTIPKEASGIYQLNLLQFFSYFDLRGSNFQGCRISGFDPRYFTFSDYTFDRAYLEKEWPGYVMDERIPMELRNLIYEMKPVEFSYYNVKGAIIRYIPYFSTEILKRIIRVYHFDGSIPTCDEMLLVRIMKRLIGLYECDSYWYELMRKE